jgi:hypothetical protein
VNSEVRAGLETEVAELAYEYAFLRRPDFEISATAGVHKVRFDLGLEALTASRSVALDESISADGPLPVIGAHGVWRFAEQFYTDLQVQFFRLDIDAYNGRIEDYTASIVWQPFRHFGLGAGYNEFVTHANVESSRFDGHVRWRYGGARIFVVASF